MRKFLSCLGAVGLALTALIALPASASANNDPHRIFFGYSAPVELGVEYCGFPVLVEFPVNKEYATETDLPDGTAIFKITGGLIVTITNTVTHVSTKVNASGPATTAFHPDGTATWLRSEGVSMYFAPNLMAFGYPSNIIQVANSDVPITLDLATHTVLQMPRSARVLRDICAELS